ncbi:MAG TPA: YqgE/AlgH family protein, partial [Puia sp.]|nr:YqgE/AlgH family protein [Puia sp.]
MDSPAAGILLIADPFLKDPNFKRSVIFLCEHQSEGSFGFLLNKTYEYSLKDLVNNADDLEIPVYFGGPVQTDTIHFLHQYPDLIPGGYQVIDGIYWGGNFEEALDLIRAGKIQTSKIR